ncbi:MAG: hypothetical protein R3290_10015 [Acidimicrobiia bacterium]|nr:hypothetical protein [Acidimicrobiia bacterium]
MEKITGSRSTIVVLVGALITVLGSFLTWASVSAAGVSVSVSGTGEGGDGLLTLILALATGAVAIFLSGRPGRARMISIVIGAALIVLIAVINIADVNSVAGDLGGGVDVSIGIGLWLVLLGGIVAAVGAFLPDAEPTVPPTV